MRGDDQIASEPRDRREARPKRRYPGGMVGEAVVVGRYGAQTVGIDEVVAHSALARPPRPGRAARRVPRRRMSRQP